MQRVDKTPLSKAPDIDPGLLDGIRSEVTNETRPFLQFILKYARWIIGVVVVLVVALVATAIYNKVMASQEAELQESLAKIRQVAPDASQLEKLEALAGSCPARLRVSVYADLAASALVQGNFDKAAEAYAFVAREAADTPMGQVAAVNQAGALLSQGKYAEGVSLLQDIVGRLPEGSDVQPRLMLAEGAVRAGQYDLAASTYEALAGNGEDSSNGFYAARAAKIRAMGAEKN